MRAACSWLRRHSDVAMPAAFLARLALIALLTIPALAGGTQASRWGAGYVPNVPVVTQDGRTLRFYDDLIRDKVVVVSFLYTSCRDICPLAAARLGQLQDRLGDRVGRDIFLLTISIDPENDTPEQMRKYAEAFGAKPGWIFLTGAPEHIAEIRYKLGERSRALYEHRNDLMLGNGRTGEWQRDSAMGDLDRLVVTILAMDPAWRSTEPASRQAATDDVYTLGGPPGEALFRKACAGCHTIGEGDRAGPDLAGVTDRRPRAWLTRFIANPALMRKRKDPTALALAAKFPVVRMPAIGVSESEAADLVAYIENRSLARPRKPRLEALFALDKHDGTPFAATDVAGRAVAVVFGFTQCPDVCPTALLEWSNLLASLGPDADRLRVLFVTVDPERDTPEVLRSYLTAFDGRIVALSGSTGETMSAAAAFGAHFERIEGSGGEVGFDHSVKTYLLDQHGNAAGAIDFAAAEGDRLARVKALLAR